MQQLRLHHYHSNDGTPTGTAVATGSGQSEPLSQAARLASAGAAGSTTFGAGAQPATAFGKPMGPFRPAPISFGNPTPSNSSQDAPVIGAAANQQSPFRGKPAGPTTQSGMAVISADENCRSTAAYTQLFSQFIGPASQSRMAVWALVKVPRMLLRMLSFPDRSCALQGA